MPVCINCGNDYRNSFEVIQNEKSYIFDCFECAIHYLAPSCIHCGTKIIGHGIEAGNSTYYCCANCARRAGVEGAKDHV